MNVLFYFCLLSVAFCSFNVNDYQFSATLVEDTYWLYWNFSNAKETIKFAVQVKTTGWIGFGISPNGQMPESDVVIGWIDDYSTAVFHDRYAFGRYTPPIDPIQNWFVTSAEQQNGYTTLEFYRQFVTCDELDREILLETARIVYSWNDNFQSSDTTLSRHTNKGSTSINLLGGLPYSPTIPEDAQTFAIGVQEVEVPNSQTTYWCAGIKLDSSIFEYEKYIIKVSAYVTSGNEQYVHHMLVYICDGLNEETDLGQGGNCDSDISDNMKSCLSQLLIGAWAIGGSEFVYPEHVAFPIGGPNEPQYAVIQIHYNNLNEVSGIVDSSGFIFTYTDTPRQYSAGILFFGHAVTEAMVIPPNAVNFTTIGFCPNSCTEKFIPSGGIHIFANMLHTHLAGAGLKLAHINKAECSGKFQYQELKPIEKNLHYDFNFQQATHLPQPITIQPGDNLLLECYYNTTGRSGITMGGESTLQEMCLSFPVYYPRLELSKCISVPLFDNFPQFINSYVPDEYKQYFYSLNPDTDSETLENTMNLLEWTEDQISGYQNLIYWSGIQLSYCGNHAFANTTPVTSCCSYEAPNVCTGYEPSSCCQRECVTGLAAATMTKISIISSSLIISLTAIILM